MVTYVSIRLTKCKMQIIWSYEKLELPAIVCNFEGIIRSADHQFPGNMQPLDFLSILSRNTLLRREILTISKSKNSKIYLRLQSRTLQIFCEISWIKKSMLKYKNLIFIRVELLLPQIQFSFSRMAEISKRRIRIRLLSSDGETRLLYLISG